jgi:uncharacterized protein (UPF0335 family)
MSNVETTVTHIGAQPPPIGDNSSKFANVQPNGSANDTPNAKPNTTAAQLRSVVARIESMEEEKKVIADDIRDIYAEAKGNGFDVKALRAIVRLRKMDANDRAEQETILDTYMQAMGMI